ncbi:hypothetical protein BGAL_0113g00110 [Botrytis galanthina]|uniref:Uncharacterized protein n=1 Tax=Botrytis galanthina TaxID=278940 RepID=A0A4V4HUZ9_9HELO|nr:hypothetical protein BGAL_0113g00110 [Botrytis galanthina]
MVTATLFELPSLSTITQKFKGYGIVALLNVYGSHPVWLLQAQIIGELQDEDALAFKKMACDECTMIAVAAAIVAQIAITGLSLDSLSKTHWTAKSCFVISLTFALVSVYYSVTQQRILGRLIKAKDVRHWIRGRKHAFNRILSMEVGIKLDSCEPDDYSPDDLDIRKFRRDFQRQCFIPSPLSVMTLSAPRKLLSGSLILFIIGLGIYLGQYWVHELDHDRPATDSRNVFILYFIGLYLSGAGFPDRSGTAEPNGTKYAILLYITGLVLFVGAYSTAQSFGIEEVRSEIDVNEYMAEFKANHPSQDTEDKRGPQTAQITTRTDENCESDALLKQAKTSGKTSFAAT